jgi:hypothetical protein
MAMGRYWVREPSKQLGWGESYHAERALPFMTLSSVSKQVSVLRGICQSWYLWSIAILVGILVFSFY